jgi:hypothetical protein
MNDMSKIINEIMADPVAAFIEHAGGSDETALQHLPNRTRGGIVRYVLLGIPTGSFLIAVFSSDTDFAFHKADAQNRPQIDNFFQFVETECPEACQGSANAVNKWIRQGGLLKLDQSHD